VQCVVVVEAVDAVEQTDATDCAPEHEIVMRRRREGCDEREQGVAAVALADVE
jgi:hypothetical protein